MTPLGIFDPDCYTADRPYSGSIVKNIVFGAAISDGIDYIVNVLQCKYFKSKTTQKIE